MLLRFKGIDIDVPPTIPATTSSAYFVRSVVYAGEGCPKGYARDAILEALKENPEATSSEIAERVGCGVRYIQNIRKKLREE